jgi:hypothetical protein
MRESSKSDKSNEDEVQQDSSPANILGKKHRGGESSAVGMGSSQQMTSSSTPSVVEFPNGKDSLKFEEFISLIKNSC